MRISNEWASYMHGKVGEYLNVVVSRGVLSVIRLDLLELNLY